MATPEASNVALPHREQAVPAAGPKTAYLGYCGLIDSAGVTRICQALNAMVNQQFTSIYLCLTSNGGYVGDGVYLYNHIRALPVPVTMHNTGTVASIAATLFVAGTHRLASPRAIFMMHPIAVSAQGSLHSAPLVTALQSALADEERTEAILRERTKMTAELLQARRSGELYLSAHQALELALVQEVGEFTLPAGNQIFQI